MKLTGIRLPGFKLDKHGRLVRDVRRLDVSTGLKQASKRVKVLPPRPGSRGRFSVP
jgi:hypothetical protein